MSGGVQLALCASERRFSVALRVEGTVFVDRPETSNAGDMAARVQVLCARHGVAPPSIQEVLVDVGPGSYTGLRVAVTFARILSEFGGAKIRTVTSLELMALAAWRAGAVEPTVQVRPVLDARRHRLHHGALRLRTEATGERIETVLAPAATALAELEAAIEPGDVVLAADALGELLDPVVAVQEAARVAPHPFDAGSMFDPSLAAVTTLAEELEPLYLMGSYAET